MIISFLWMIFILSVSFEKFLISNEFRCYESFVKFPHHRVEHVSQLETIPNIDSIRQLSFYQNSNILIQLRNTGKTNLVNKFYFDYSIENPYETENGCELDA